MKTISSLSIIKVVLMPQCQILPFSLKLAPAKARTCNIYNYAKSSWIIYLFDYTTKIVDICIWTHWSEDLAILRLTPNPFSHPSLVVNTDFLTINLLKRNFQHFVCLGAMFYWKKQQKEIVLSFSKQNSQMPEYASLIL